MIWSSDDIKGAFYLFTLPKCWRPFMTFSKPVRWRALGIDKDGVTYLAVCVVPMGWASAVALFQHLHRRMGITRSLPDGRELRRDRPLPMRYVSGEQSWVQIFLDDFDAPRILEKENLQTELDRPAPLQLAQHREADKAGVHYSLKQRVRGQLVVQRLGALVDGEVGRISAPEDAIIGCAYFVCPGRVLG